MRKLTKYKGVIVVVTFIVLLLNSIAFINTYVSEKYETQLIGIEKNIDPIEMKTKMNQIKQQRAFLIGFSILILIVTIIIVSRSEEKQNSKLNNNPTV